MSSVDPKGLAVGLASGEGRDVACRERSRIRFVSESTSSDEAPTATEFQSAGMHTCMYLALFIAPLAPHS